MLHLVFEEDELKTTPVAVEGLVDLGQRTTTSHTCVGTATWVGGVRRCVCCYLVCEQVLLVAGGVSGHLQTEDTEQEARVSMETGKVLQDVGVEGRAVGTHL